MDVRTGSDLSAPTRHDAGRADLLGRMGVRSFLRTAVLALFTVALLAADVSAAGSRPDLTSAQSRQLARQTLLSIKPALNASVGDVLPGSLDALVGKGTLTPLMAEKYRQVFIEGKAPAGMPDVAHALSLPEDQRDEYTLQRLQETGRLNASEAKFFRDLEALPDEQVRGVVVTALESGTFGALGSAILQVAVDLSAIDPGADLETCDASRVDAADGIGNTIKWLGGLVKNVVRGARLGAMVGGWFGGHGATIGAVVGGVAGGVIYIAKSTGGNGFMPGPNGEGCSGWPRGFPAF